MSNLLFSIPSTFVVNSFAILDTVSVIAFNFNFASFIFSSISSLLYTSSISSYNKLVSIETFTICYQNTELERKETDEIIKSICNK